MRVLLFCVVMLCVMQLAICQNIKPVPSVVFVKHIAAPISPPLSTAPYDIAKINRNLLRDKRMIISGSVLTGAGCVFVLAGGLLAIPSEPKTYTQTGPNGTAVERHPSEGNFAPFILWMASAPLLVPGIPIMSVGLSQRHKWKQRKKNLDVQAGVLSNAHVGLAMAF